MSPAVWSLSRFGKNWGRRILDTWYLHTGNRRFFPTESELLRIARLQERCSDLLQRETDEDRLITNAWADNRRRLLRTLSREDPRNFLRWRIITNTMFVRSAPYVVKELWHLYHQPGWVSRWRPALIESEVGCPPRFWLYPSSSGNLIHHLYHVARFEEATRRRIDGFDCVFEFGGGYGNMCRVFSRLGFRGKYIIFDMDVLSALQEFYLSSLGLGAKSARDGEPIEVRLTSDWRILDDYLQGGLRVLVLGTWSVSETPESVRVEVFRRLQGARAALFAYQDIFEGIDNRISFATLKKQCQHLSWIEMPIQHIPGNTYLFGCSSDGYR